MKKLTFLFTLILLLNGCSSDDNSSTEQEQLINGGEVFTSEIVIINNDNLNQDEYQATLGSQNINLVRTSENELAFIVPNNINLGEQILSINALNNLKVKYLISESILVGTLEENISPYISNIQNYIDTVESTESQAYLNDVLNSFTESFNNSSDSDKTSIATLYQTNKNYFDNLITNDFSSRSSFTDYPFKFQLAVYTLGASAILAITYPEPASKALLLVSAVVVAKKAYDYGISFINLDNIKVDNITLGGLISSLQNRSMNSSLELFSGVEASFPLESRTRAIITSDENDGNETISGFFNNLTIHNSTIQNLNLAINFINDNFFFSDIDNLPILLVNQDNPIVSTIGDESFYNSLNFSIDDDNVNIENITFSNGNINITVTLVDESIVNDFVETSISFTYQNEYNLLSGSFPTIIYLENDLTQRVLNLNTWSWSSGITYAVSFFGDGTCTFNAFDGTDGTWSLVGNTLTANFYEDINNWNFNLQAVYNETTDRFEGDVIQTGATIETMTFYSELY